MTTQVKPDAVHQTETDAVDALAVLESALEVKQTELDKLHQQLELEMLNLSRIRDDQGRLERETAQRLREKQAQFDAHCRSVQATQEERARNLEQAEAALEQKTLEAQPELLNAESLAAQRKDLLRQRAEVEQLHLTAQESVTKAQEFLTSAMQDKQAMEPAQRQLAQDMAQLKSFSEELTQREIALGQKEKELAAREENLKALREELKPGLDKSPSVAKPAETSTTQESNPKAE